MFLGVSLTFGDSHWNLLVFGGTGSLSGLWDGRDLSHFLSNT